MQTDLAKCDFILRLDKHPLASFFVLADTLFYCYFMENLQDDGDWRQAARSTIIQYCESEDKLKQVAKDNLPLRKEVKENKAKVQEMLKTNNVKSFSVPERGYKVDLINKTANVAANAKQLKARCLEWPGGPGEELYKMIKEKVVVEKQSLQRVDKAKTNRGRKKKKHTVEDSDDEDEDEED